MDKNEKHKQIGQTCGVYSLAYALKKLKVVGDIPSNQILEKWAQKVAFNGEVEDGCDPIALTGLAFDMTFEKSINAQLYVDIKTLVEYAKSNTKLKIILETLDKEAEKNLGDLYQRENYDFHKLRECDVCIGIFVQGQLKDSEVKEAFLKQFIINPAGLHYMMIEKTETGYYVRDSNIGENTQYEMDDNVALDYTYSGLAIVLSKNEGK